MNIATMRPPKMSALIEERLERRPSPITTCDSTGSAIVSIQLDSNRK